MENKRCNSRRYLKDASQIAECLEILKHCAGWTMDEFKTIKALLTKGFETNIKNAKKYFDDGDL